MTNRNHSLGRRLVRFLKWAVPLVLVVGVIVLAFLPRAVEVDVGEVTQGPMMLTVDEDGATRIRERYTISAPLAGRLLRVELDPGDPIAKDDLLATLDPGEPNLLDPRRRAQAQASMKAAEASLDRAKSQLENALVEADMREKAYVRGKVLYAQGNMSESAMEEAECLHLGAQLAIKASESAVNIAAFDLEQARAALLHTADDDGSPGNPDEWHFRIRSPIDGRVLRIFEESSTVVPAGGRLLEIGDPNDLELTIDVLSQDAVKIRPGQRVILEHWGGKQPLTARVRYVEPSAYTKVSALGVDEQRVDVIADLEDTPGEGETLGDGFRVEARVVVWESVDTLILPAGALFRAGDDWAVYRLAGKIAELVTIEAGRNNGNEVEILGGLVEGDQVILHPSDQIKDGTLVKGR